LRRERIAGTQVDAYLACAKRRRRFGASDRDGRRREEIEQRLRQTQDVGGREQRTRTDAGLEDRNLCGSRLCVVDESLDVRGVYIGNLG